MIKMTWTKNYLDSTYFGSKITWYGNIRVVGMLDMISITPLSLPCISTSHTPLYKIEWCVVLPGLDRWFPWPVCCDQWRNTSVQGKASLTGGMLGKPSLWPTKIFFFYWGGADFRKWNYPKLILNMMTREPWNYYTHIYSIFQNN